MAVGSSPVLLPSEFVTISLVAHQAFCPRRAWLESVGERVDSAPMQVGASAHKSVDDAKSGREGRRTAIDVFHDQWGVTGRLDVLQGTEGSLVIREHKSTPIRLRAEVTPAMRVQLALQRECLEQMGHRHVETEVFFTTHNKVVPVELDGEDVQNARDLVWETRRTVSSDCAPAPLEDDPRCMRCSHASVCLPDERRLRSPARKVLVGDPDAQVVHLATPGSRARVRSGRLIVEKGGEKLGEVPLELIQGLQVHGNVDLSSGLLRELFWRDVSVAWCSGTGRLYGVSKSLHSPNGHQRVQQHVASAEGRLGLAREFVSAKISNQRTKLRRAGAPKALLEALKGANKAADVAPTWQQLIGAEGEAASAYFSNWSLLITDTKRNGWPWSGRSGRPATDPPNALLNYVYALLTADAVKALASCGLDPHAGFLHSSRRNKPALALDLIEEFRAPIADSVVQTVINNGEITPDQFRAVMGTYRLNDGARRSLISAYERRMATEIRHPVFGYRASWRRTLEVQARQILGFLDGSQERYVGVRVR